jgi:regulator of PEP synthase PpsR (kinase-PPPase family)
LAQFGAVEVKIIRKARIHDAESAREAIQTAKAQNALVCHSFVAPKIREAVIREAEKEFLATIDILGPILTALNDRLNTAPKGQPGLSYELNKEHFDRLDAVDFTVAHDDGLRIDELGRAEVVLVGVSRVSKSVTCFYLATHGVRAANVPLMPGEAAPSELIELPPEKVIGLTMNVDRLRQIRLARKAELGTTNVRDYTDDESIELELRQAHALMARHQWRRIDISYKSVEEVAQEVIRMIR